MASEGLARGFTQISYVVRDLDATARFFQQALGVGHFGVRQYKLGGGGVKLMAGDRAVESEIGIRIALARAGARGELEIELIAPDGGDSMFSRFVQRTGGGLHHAAFAVDDFDHAVRPLQGEGMTPRIALSGGGKIAYFDCRGAGASIVEVAQYDEAMRLEFEQLKGPVAIAPPDAPRLVQVSYTVRDLDAVTQWWKRALGVEYFGITRATAGRDYEVLIRDEPAATPFSLQTAMGRLGPRGEQEIEIIQPLDGPSPYRDFLDQRGEGLNHVSFLVPEFEPAAARMRACGAAPLIEFRGHGIRACYFDCRAAGASIVEIACFDEKATAAMEKVKTPREKRSQS